MEKNIIVESIKNKSYEEMSREEKQFFCENSHLSCENTNEDNGIIIVDIQTISFHKVFLLLLEFHKIQVHIH